MRDYILRAIELGIDVYGFSEHAPMNYDPKYRMRLTDIESYEKSIDELKDEFAQDIKILKAYEVDYIDGYVLDEVLTRKVDYLIGSVHFLKENRDFWGFDNPEFIGNYKNKDINQIWIDYFSALENLAKKRVFDIVGHLDLIKVFNFKPTKDIKSIAYDALKEIKKSDMVIEINSAGLRKPVVEQYPSKEILELAYELDIPITFGSDAHSVEQVGLNYDKVTNLAKSVGYDKCAIFEAREKKLVSF